MKGIIKDFKMKKDTKVIIENIKSLIEEEEFYSIEGEEMKEILQKSRFEIGREGKLIKTLIHNIINKYGEEGLGIVKYVECGNIEIDFESDSEPDKNTNMEIETLIDILEELTEIPIIRETSRYLKMKKDKMNENEECELTVDWEKQFREEEEKNKELAKQLKEMRTKYKAMHSTLQKKIPHEREYSKREIKTMFEIFEKRDLKNATNILTKDPSLIFIKSEYEDTLLTKASEDGWIEGIELLLDLGVGVDGFVETRDDDGNTPLILATRCGKFKVVKYLTEKGANIESKDNNGWTPLMMAISVRKFKVVKYLTENGANIEAKDKDGWTPLMMAITNGELDIVKYLIEKGANIEAKDNNGETPLMWASSEGELEIVKYLIEEGANIEAKDNDGETLLIKASSEGKLETVKYLIEKGANIEAKDKEGNTPIEISKKCRRKEVEGYLRSVGSKE